MSLKAKISVFVLLVLASIGVCVTPCSAQSGPPITPASYAVATKWLNRGVYTVRIAAYSLRSDGTARADYWQWTSRDSYVYASAARIGVGGPMNSDADQYVKTERRFLGSESSMTTEFGRYVTWNGGTQIRITWNNGSREYWRRTWHDATLNKIELYYTTRASVARDTYLYMNPWTLAFSRNDDAVNAGFGFGAPYGFNNTGLPISSFDADYRGLVSRWNGYYDTPNDNEGVTSWMMKHRTKFTLTNRQTWRFVTYVPERQRYVYYYTTRPSWNPGLTSRRVVVQQSHDWNSNGHIADNFGHMYFGLQVIDSAGAPRGFVFADATWDLPTASMKIMSAMFVIDDHSFAAQAGIE